MSVRLQVQVLVLEIQLFLVSIVQLLVISILHFLQLYFVLFGLGIFLHLHFFPLEVQ